MKQLYIVFFLSLFSGVSYAQCCAVGGGSPLAGDASQGVLRERQFEINSNFQYINSTNFLTEDKRDTNFLERFSSKYVYSRFAYGLSDRLTMSVETGYWVDKTQIGIREGDTYNSKGIGDLILFPRYNIIKASAQNKFTELTFGMGVKLPLGSYNDSIGRLEPFSGEILYSTKPPAVQATSGAQDILLSLFYSGGLPGGKMKLSANLVYILKGWNPLGEKLGNYASAGLFLGRNFQEKLNVALQLKAEFIGSMLINPDVMMMSFPNYDPEATGSKKLFVSPQLSYSAAGGLTLFAQTDFPVYQYVNKTQIASQTQFTIGLTYRFLLRQTSVINPAGSI